MPKKISVSDPVYDRIIAERDNLASALDRQVTISEILDRVLDQWTTRHEEEEQGQ